MARSEWKRTTWYSTLATVVIFVIVFGLGLYLGAAFNEATHYVESVGDDMAAAGWKWHRGNARTTFPLAPEASATTTPKPVAKTPQPKPATPATSSAPKTTTVVATTTPTPAPAQTPPATTQPAPTSPTPAPVTVPSTPTTNEKRFSAYITAYTYWDNTPPGSSDISHPIIHQKAGGTGTYSDPITVAVGHDLSTGKDVLDYPAGTKFYLPYLKKYFIVEDTCGDGSKPQNGPCHTGYQGNPWIDLWIDGANGSRSATDNCAANITDIHTVIQNPASNYAVVSGSVYNNGCAQQFSDAPVTL